MSKTAMLFVGTTIGGLILLLVILASSYISANNYGAKTEASIEAQWKNNKNILAQYEQKVLEVVQVPSMYKDDMKEVITSAMTGRYGDDGSKAVFQWIQEKMPNFDYNIYSEIQRIIASGRKDFELGQTKLLDMQSQYEAQLGYFWRGLWLNIAGFPKKDLSEFTIVTTERTENVFETGIEKAPLKLR